LRVRRTSPANHAKSDSAARDFRQLILDRFGVAAARPGIAHANSGPTRAVGQNHTAAGVIQLVTDPFGRQYGNERQVNRTEFQNAEKRSDPTHAARREHPDRLLVSERVPAL
jgi:hypothetical protein